MLHSVPADDTMMLHQSAAVIDVWSAVFDFNFLVLPTPTHFQLHQRNTTLSSSATQLIIYFFRLIIFSFFFSYTSFSATFSSSLRRSSVRCACLSTLSSRRLAQPPTPCASPCCKPAQSTQEILNWILAMDLLTHLSSLILHRSRNSLAWPN